MNIWMIELWCSDWCHRETRGMWKSWRGSFFPPHNLIKCCFTFRPPTRIPKNFILLNLSAKTISQNRCFSHFLHNFTRNAKTCLNLIFEFLISHMPTYLQRRHAPPVLADHESLIKPRAKPKCNLTVNSF